MPVVSVAPRKRSERPLCWLRGLARAALAWVFVCITVLLPLSRLSEMSGSAQALLIAAFVLCVSAGFGMMLLAADAVRDRG